MLTPTAIFNRLSGLSAGRHGWIGVEIGPNSATLVQVERAGADWRLAARWCVADDAGDVAADALTDAATDPGTWIASRRDELRRARGLMRGKNTAVCLAGPATMLRNMQIPDGSSDDRADMIRQELTTDDDTEATGFEVDSWPIDETGAAGRQLELVTVAVRGDLADRVATGLFRAGYHPRVLDVAPYAMARAVRLCDPFGDEPTIGLKIDADSALFVLMQNGRPGFCRILRGCGLRSIAEPLVAKLGLSIGECEQVLRRHGIPAEAVAGTPSADSFFRLFSVPLQKLVDEVKRTCSFIHQGNSEQAPARIWLFGDGAAVRNLPQYLSAKCGIATVGWSPAFPAAGEVDDVRYGVAAGLSALAWEV
jgi:type IV pilus assembly protein PilM